MNDIRKDVQLLAENSNKTEAKIDAIKDNTEESAKSSKSKLPIIIGIIGVVVTTISAIPAITALLPPNSSPSNTGASNESALPTDAVVNEIFLYCDHRKLRVGAETAITASLNFNADSVAIDAYLDSVHSGDTIKMTQKSSSEWQANIYFTEAGIFNVVATATAPDGTVIEGSVEIEVISHAAE